MVDAKLEFEEAQKRYKNSQKDLEEATKENNSARETGIQVHSMQETIFEAAEEIM